MAPPASYKGYNHQGKCRHYQLSSPVKNEIRQQLNLLNFVENESPALFLDDDDDEETTTVDNGIDLDPKIIIDNTETLNNNNNNTKPAGNEHKKSMDPWPELDENQSKKMKNQTEKSNKRKNPLSFVAALLSPKKN
ncbi:hypothetical protein DERP_005397 [Dermatophagoides pteronyssinus]|uniref:Uncharacterized protein n=1 Tax=Dermatophagoides pteronyssinus TaxID=6956 RepID=A0ABQ8JMH5_DERPT|nr:hypothetical protein DERP_005397 [Dermatophagoides pteronyssinus]